MTAEIATTVRSPDPIDLALSPRIPLRESRSGLRSAKAQCRALVRETRAAAQRYRGGLAAEQQSLTALRGEIAEKQRATRSGARAAWLSRQGRPIDLWGLLSQWRADGTPIWTIADPRRALGHANGKIEQGGYGIFMYWSGGDNDNYIHRSNVFGKHNNKAFLTAGMPALPKRVRELICDPKIQKRANRIGVLFMPDSWTEVKPDPALVVEWKDLPGQYFALAVWGGDRARIMEWVS